MEKYGSKQANVWIDVEPWYQHECDDLEIRQNGMGWWLWDVGNVRNELIRGDTEWRAFEEREAKSMVK